MLRYSLKFRTIAHKPKTRERQNRLLPNTASVQLTPSYSRPAVSRQVPITGFSTEPPSMHAGPESPLQMKVTACNYDTGFSTPQFLGFVAFSKLCVWSGIFVLGSKSQLDFASPPSLHFRAYYFLT